MNTTQPTPFYALGTEIPVTQKEIEKRLRRETNVAQKLEMGTPNLIPNHRRKNLKILIA